MLLYYYESLRGYHMPSIHKGTAAELEAQNALSVTPIVGIISVTDENREDLLLMLQAHLSATDKRETGLIYSLKRCIASLTADRIAYLTTK